MRAIYVGRVGALAVALGVGTAIFGLTAEATADTGAENAAGSAEQESTPSGDSGRATGRTRAGGRASAPNVGNTTNEVTAARRSGGLRSGVAVSGTPGRDTGTSPATVPQSPADVIGALLTPGGMAGLIQNSMSSLIGDLFSAVPADGVVPEVPAAPEITSAIAVVDAAVEPPVMTAQPDALSAAEVDPLTQLGEGSGGDTPLTAPLAWAAVAVSRSEELSGATPEVPPAAAVTTGEPDEVEPVAAAAEAAVAVAGFTACTTVKGCLDKNQDYIKGQIAGAVVKADPATEGVVANTIGTYGFDIINALMTKQSASAVAVPIQQLATNANILNFVSQTVAANPTVAVLPPDVAATIGNAAASFVANAFGNPVVAQAFVPFLQALKLPTIDSTAASFVLKISKEGVFPALLISGNTFLDKRQINTADMQKALINFFGDPDVRTGLGAAVTGAVNVVIGAINPLPSWATPTSPTAVADYLGQIGATAIVGADSPYNASLSTTIGSAVTGLFSAIGNTVATQAGQAFGFFLGEGSVGGQPPVGTTLATYMTNGFVKYIGGDPPFPAVALLPAVAPAAGVAVTGFTQSLLTTPTVLQGLSQFINQLIPGMLANPGVQQLLGTQADTAVSNLLTNLFGDDELAKAIGAQVGTAVANLVAVPGVQTALTSWVNALGGSILASPQAVTALANAAGGLVSVELSYGKPTTEAEAEAKAKAQAEITEALRTNAALDTVVGQSVSSGVTALFSSPEILSAVNNAAVSLITASLSDPAVQNGLGTLVADDVTKLFKNAALGAAVGAQAKAAVVSILSNPDIRTALVGLVDTMFSDFFSYPGVVPAIAKAAGEVAAADLAGDKDAAKAAQVALKANPDVQKAVGFAVGDAVRTLLSDPTVLAAVDHTAGSLVNGLLSDPAVEAELSSTVAAEVSGALGGGPLGQAVGTQAGNAVAGLLSQQAVRNALAGLVDTELGDFFKAQGVVDAFVVAANTFTLDVLSGNGANAATDARKSLQGSTAIQAAVGGIVTASVAELLNDSTLWAALDTAAANLLGGLLANPDVQQGVSTKVYTEVFKALNGTALGVAVAVQVSDAVVDLMNNPIISSGLVGVVDTVLGDFFGAPGVVTAFSTAAGELATAAVAGTSKEVTPIVLSQLRANTDVQHGVNLAVGDAVTALLTNPNLVSTMNDTLASLVSGLLGDPAVQSGLNDIIAHEVSRLLGGGPLGEAVGTQVGTAAVEILSNPVVKDALEGLVDTELGDFFRAPGVVAAFAGAADTFALDVLTGVDITTALSAAETQLRNSPAVDTAVQSIVTTAVGELLSNADVWSAVDGTASRLVADLLDDPDVQEAVAERVYTNIWVAFNGTALGEAVGDKVAAAVVSLMQNPAVSVALVGLVDTTTADFFGYPGVVGAFATAAGELASAVVTKTLDTVTPEVVAELRANTAVEQAAGVAVGDAVEALLTDDAVLTALDQKAASVVTDLLVDPAVQAKVNAQVIDDISKLVGGGPLGQAVGTQVGAAVLTFLSNPSVRAALVGLVDDELGNFFRSPGVVDAFAEAATTFALEVVTGEDVTTAASEAIAWLRADAAVDDAVVGVVTESVGALLSNANVIRAVEDGLTSLLTNLEPYAGQLVTVFVTRSLGDSPIAAPVGEALGAAVQQLLTVPGFGSGMVTIIASALPDFLNQFGVPTAVAGIAGDYLAALLAGVDQKVAEQDALTALRTNPTIDSAAKTTVADSLILANINLLSNPAIQQALGATVTTLIITLAADPAIQAFVADRDGPELAELVANAEVMGEIATTLGSVVTQFLGYPGFNAALLAAVNQFADDVIDETPDAEQNALQQLRSAPAVVAAVNAVIPPALNTLLGYSDVRQAVGVAAQEETIAALQKSGINNRFLDQTFGQIVDGTIQTLLTKQAGLNLVDALTVNILLGMPVSDWRGFTTQEVIATPSLQLALGMSIGQGIGSLFGDNIVAHAIGLAAGVPVTLAIGLTSLTVGFFQWIFGRPTYGVEPQTAAAQALTSEVHYVTIRVAMTEAHNLVGA